MARVLRVRVSAAAAISLAVSLAVAVPLLSVGAGAQGSGGSTGPSSISHFTCYTATVPLSSTPPPFVPKPAFLENQFAPNGFYSNVGPVIEHCNPVQKTITSTSPPTVTPIVNPLDHQLCFKLLKFPAQPSYTVMATNQFGTGELTTVAPFSLCVPTWKNQPAASTLVQPPGLDHYVCYRATYTKTATGTPVSPFTPPAGMTLQDQFMPAPISARIGTPNLLCLPTIKLIQPGITVPPLANPDAHLVCFPVTPVKATVTPPAQVTDQNQFGLGAVNIVRLFELCVPSFKDVINPSTGVTVNPGVVTISANASGSGIGLVGVTFQVTDGNNVVQGTCTTDYSGMCTINGLVPGPFTVTMTNPPPPAGFNAPSPQNINVSGADGSFVSIVPPWPWSA